MFKISGRKKFFEICCATKWIVFRTTKFAKLTKPLIACLRIEGVTVVDDIIVVGDTCEECLIGTVKTMKLFLELGFIIHPEKSSLQPSQEITYLGFVFNSKEKLVTLTSDKREKFFESCKSFLLKKR